MKGNNDIRHTRTWITALKVVFWVVFGVALSAVGLVLCTLRTLTPGRLTPLVEEVANRTLDAYVSVERVELSFRKSYPFLDLDMSDVVIRSKAIADLPQPRRRQMPSWADTLLTISHVHGGINPFRLYNDIIDLHDLQIDGPQVNVLIVDTTLNNFSIVPPQKESSNPLTKVPDIRLNRFRITQPHRIRYTDIANNTSVTADVRDASVTNDSDKDVYLPEYRVDFASDIASPIFGVLGQKQFNVGFNGIVDWRHDHPYELTLKDFAISLYRLSGRVDTHIDFRDEMTVKEFDLTINPLAVNDILGVIPEAYAAEKGIPHRLDTDAAVSARVHLLRPYVLGSVLMPHADIDVDVPDCYLNYDNMQLCRIVMSLGITLRGSTPNEAVLNLRRLDIDGPSASLGISGHVTDLLDDPQFDGDVKGSMDIAGLPHSLCTRLQAIVKGRLTLDASMRARASMVSAEKFHDILVKGDVSLDRFYYLAYDTLMMYTANNARLKFGNGQATGSRADSVLRLTLNVDTAQMLISGLRFNLGKVCFTAGVDDINAAAALPPVRGRLDSRTFSMFTISDTLGVLAADISGKVTMHRQKQSARLPQLSLDLGLGRVSSGNNRMRIVFGDGDLHCDMSLLPHSSNKADTTRHAVRKRSAGVHRALPVDSVMKFARAIRARHHSPYPRVHPVITSHDTEIIDFGTSKLIRNLLLNWKLIGSLHTGPARVFTPVFPVRNRIDNLAVSFSNDTISLTNIACKAGKSDFLVSGKIANLKQGLTSEMGPVPLKINFEILSDHIDINELAGAFFTGASAHDERISAVADDKAVRTQLDKEMKSRPDSVSPFLVPMNVDARFGVTARSIGYSDIALENFTGTVLMSGGALNLHDCRASSAGVGAVSLEALYSAPTATDMNFGFGMEIKNFNIRNFLKLMPPVDSLMPLMRDLSGMVSADIAATTRITPAMTIDLPTMKAALRLQADSVVFLSEEMYHKISKWLLFKRHERNMVDHVDVGMVIDDGSLRLYPFIFDFNRYSLGIEGYTAADLMMHYHVAVLKSPIPFKFGINVSGPYDHLKIRLGRAHFDEKKAMEQQPAVADVRRDLVDEIQKVFRRGTSDSGFAKVPISKVPLAEEIDLFTDTITAADSLYLIREGFIPQ
ncbi:MAG: hypothetical protein K2K37_12750 [Muribaculaceae bacterium]|nr:hypothetical protein [Muribaculaceae bacterium]